MTIEFKMENCDISGVKGKILEGEAKVTFINVSIDGNKIPDIEKVLTGEQLESLCKELT